MTVPSHTTLIRPTLDWEQVSGRHWDVLVVGAGPAGATVAYELARRGVSVLLVDRASFPRWKVCGCCLNGAALSALAAIGLEDLPQRLGAVPLSQMHLAVGTARASLDLPLGVALSREVFDSGLIHAAIDAGAAFLPETEAELQPEAAAERHALLKHDAHEITVSSRLVIAADGLGGTLLKSHRELAIDIAQGAPIGAGTVFDQAPDFYAPATVYMACSRDVYVGAVRLEDGRLDVAAALQPARLRRSAGLGGLVEQVLTECRFPCPAELAKASWRGTPPLTRFRRRLVDNRLFVLGDAAGYVEPFTGEGMSWAIQAAILAVPYVLDSLQHWSPSHATMWETRYRRFFSQHEQVCVHARNLLKHHLLARAAVRLLRLAPWLASPWLRRVATVDPDVTMLANASERNP